jgi:hypothetical protein
MIAAEVHIGDHVTLADEVLRLRAALAAAEERMKQLEAELKKHGQ